MEEKKPFIQATTASQTQQCLLTEVIIAKNINNVTKLVFQCDNLIMLHKYEEVIHKHDTRFRFHTWRSVSVCVITWLHVTDVNTRRRSVPWLRLFMFQTLFLSRLTLWRSACTSSGTDASFRVSSPTFFMRGSDWLRGNGTQEVSFSLPLCT